MSVVLKDICKMCEDNIGLFKYPCSNGNKHVYMCKDCIIKCYNNLDIRKLKPKNIMARVIVITSGKGGVGKTTTTSNIGMSLARLGKTTLLIDADVGLRNLDLL